MSNEREVKLTVNGVPYEARVEPRMLLSDFLRHELALTGTHVGCEHGVCGICTILMDGKAVRSCLTLAVQADGHEFMTVEGLAKDGKLHPLQEAFLESFGLQCGFCTPGFLLAIYELLRDNPKPDEEQIMDVLSGELCRCTGYEGIRKAVALAVEKLQSGQPANA
jgi:carbon-monoxide dehydrogenase small subunit